MVWPESVLPEASVIVPDTMIGISIPLSIATDSTAKSAAFAFNVSNIVSIKISSAPPSINARVASE